jgi:transposase
MLDQTQRQTILTLREAGHGIRAIARALGISRIAVKRVLASGDAQPPPVERAEKAEAHRDDILALYAECKGNLVRVHEELAVRGIVTLSYPALTAFCRKHGIGHAPKKPAGRYTFEPGKEMQHDTSPHDVDIGGALRRVQTASLVLCHSHRLFFQFYPRFTRFECKLFLTEGAQYHDGTCEHCMVDNTHVIVLGGTGKDMVPVPEMEAFGRRLHFTFIAHEKGDANRSARVERPFDHIERNFLAGRTFADFADANRQARAWCDQLNARVRRAWQTSSNELYRAEWPALRRLPPWLPLPADRQAGGGP